MLRLIPEPVTFFSTFILSNVSGTPTVITSDAFKIAEVADKVQLIIQSQER